MARTKYSCSPERFIEVWQQANSSDEAAENLGMPKRIMHARAAKYRAAGVRLKRMPRRPRHKLNVEGLNQLIDGFRPVGDDGSIAF